MNKLSKILIIVVTILSIALIIMTLMYVNARKGAKKNLEAVLENANATYEANIKINELEEELEKYKNNSTTNTITNTLNTNTTVSSEPYIPEGMEVAEPNDSYSDNVEIKASDLEFNRSPENVTIEVLEDTITRDSIEILITDNNEDKYGWGAEFSVQKKVNGQWEDLKYVSDRVSWIAIAYNLNEDNQLTQKLNIKNYYGTLENGIYRIVKPVGLYSNEFEIK